MSRVDKATRSEQALRDPNSYASISASAVETEKAGHYLDAMRLWKLAAKAASNYLNRDWAAIRAERCFKMARHAREVV